MAKSNEKMTPEEEKLAAMLTVDAASLDTNGGESEEQFKLPVGRAVAGHFRGFSIESRKSLREPGKLTLVAYAHIAVKVKDSTIVVKLGCNENLFRQLSMADIGIKVAIARTPDVESSVRGQAPAHTYRVTRWADDVENIPHHAALLTAGGAMAALQEDPNAPKAAPRDLPALSA